MNSSNVFSFFDEITKIPRESGHEEKIIAYLQKFAQQRSLECKTDEVGNVLIRKPGTKGMESAPTVILQSHSDMVCEKNSGVDFNFDTDPIRYIEENGWLIAKETTLGADCGIGIAAQLAILDSNELSHGPIEALFTTEEETGLDGAKALKPGFLTGKFLINLDSEDEGEIFIGCAGGLDTTAKFDYKAEEISQGLVFLKTGFYGATGGHSGDDIEKGRANANQLLMRFLYQLSLEIKFHLCHIDGGNKRNTIAREAYAVIAVEPADAGRVERLFKEVEAEVKAEHIKTDTELYGKIEKAKPYKMAIEGKVTENLLFLLNGMLHGVLAMSMDMPGMVETSTNLASIKIEKEGVIRIGTSQRSSVSSARYNAGRRVESLFRLAGANVAHENEYPGWKPNTESSLLELSRNCYKDLFGKEPIVRAIHAGLECGMFLDIYPHLDMISFGPTLRGVHAPGERLEIASVGKFWALLTDLLSKIK